MNELASKIEHGLFQISGNAVVPQFFRIFHHFFFSAGGRCIAIYTLQQFVEVTPATITGQIGIVCRRNQADGFGRPGKHVADGVRQTLQFIGFEADFVVYDIVMRRSRGALQSAVC
jgi:hypothetical protein